MTDQTEPMLVFDRPLLRRRRARAAARLAEHDFLFAHIAGQLAERLDDIARSFTRGLDLGCHGGEVARALGPRLPTELFIQCDPAEAMARRAASPGRPALAADEDLLPFAEESFDLVVSNLSLHWVNDLPGALIQVNRALRPDGLFIGAMLGGDTLNELRRALIEAELEVTGGASPRLSPYAELRDMAGLLQRAGFALPVADSETITVTYADAFRLFADLRGMGETNAALNRNPAPPPRALWVEAARRYHALFADEDGRIPATFQVIYLIGWAPHESQQKPLRPGSARASLAEALGSAEYDAGDEARPGLGKSH
jgi:SAM-dependent methyltransferase